MQLYLYRYSVRGRGTFPLDMLRHDRACPDTGDDVIAMECTDAERTIRLVSHLTAPTEGRWQSFGWPVVDQKPKQKMP